MPIATAFDLGDLGNPNNPFVDWQARYEPVPDLVAVCGGCDREPVNNRCDYCDTDSPETYMVEEYQVMPA